MVLKIASSALPNDCQKSFLANTPGHPMNFTYTVFSHQTLFPYANGFCKT